VQAMLAPTPEQRKTMAEILKLNFFANFNWTYWRGLNIICALDETSHLYNNKKNVENNNNFLLK
jgi:hypothetical protein